MSAAEKSPSRNLLRIWFPVLALVVPLPLAVVLAPLFGTVFIQRTVTEAMISIVVVVCIYVFVGNTGVISFGSATFIAIAAYAEGWQTCCAMLKPITMPGLPSFIRDQTIPLITAAASSILLATAVLFLCGPVLMRMGGLAASISTLAVLHILNASYSNWRSVTMGTASMVLLPTYVTGWVGLGAATVSIAVAQLFKISNLGLAVRSTRADEVAPAACGISMFRSRLIAFTLSGAILGLGGVLAAHFLDTVTINAFFLNLTFLTLALLVADGMGSLAEAGEGVIVETAIVDVFQRLERGISIGGEEWALPVGAQELILASVMLLLLVSRKNGLMGGRELRLPKRQSPMHTAGASHS